jgi:hypothetical protein
MVDKNKALVCCLLFVSHIGHNVNRKEEKKSVKREVRSGI